MAKTNLQRNAAYYEKLIKEAKSSPHSEKYNNVCDALEKLVQITDRLEGVNHQMSSQEYKDIVKGYNAVQKACQVYLGGENFSTFEQKRKGIIADISSVVEKDLNVLVKCNPLEPGTLSEVMEKSRTQKIVLNRDDIQMVGAAQSSRIPLKTNNGKKGFFTPTTTFNLDKEWQQTLAKFEGKFSKVSDKCKERLQLLKTNGDFQTKIAFLVPNSRIRNNERNNVNVKKAMAYLAQGLGMAEDGPGISKLFMKNKDLYDALIDYSNSIVDLANKQGIMHVAGIKKGSNISSRNCAMTDMAKMLGCSHLLANSVPMKVEINGTEIEGVFMESAEGTDIARLKEDDLIFQANYKSFENPEALQQITDLQVLDFVCGNTDRHTANMIYQFKKKSFGGVTFTGIKGIDNDCAFGTPNVKTGKNLMQLVKPDKMQFITADMVQSLEHIKKPMLKIKLANHHLTPEEIDAAWDRIDMVKQAVKEGKLTIVNKAYWSKHPLSAYKGGKNYISRIQGIQLSCDPKEKEFLDDYQSQQFKGVSQVKYTQEAVTASEIMGQNENAIRDLRKKMDSAKRLFNSSEYNLMKTRFEKIEKLTEKIKSYKDPKLVPEKTTDALREAYIELAEKTKKYIALKKIVPSTEVGEKRLEFAKELKVFANDTLEKMYVNLDKETEKETKKDTEEVIKEVDEPEMGAEV